MGDNSFLSPAFIILVVGVIAVVFWLVTPRKTQQEVSHEPGDPGIGMRNAACAHRAIAVHCRARKTRPTRVAIARHGRYVYVRA